jgi:sortase A
VNRRALGLPLLLAGAFALGQGGWIGAKAGLAQLLLDAAWRHSAAAAGPVKAWPWADTWPVARLTVPAHGVDQVVLEGASGEALAFGPGRLAGSAAPGAAGNLVLSGHRDTHFRFLRDLVPGDLVRVEDTRGQVHRYTVEGSEVVDARRYGLRLDGDGARLTLVTCWPFDALVPGGPLRYVVYANLADGATGGDGAI